MHLPRPDLRRCADNRNAVVAKEWNRPYSREVAAFPTAVLKTSKYWPTTGRVDNVYGDRNLMCSCVPVSDYA